MDNLKINIREINKIEGMDLKLYLDLLYLYSIKNDKKLYASFIKCHGGNVSIESANKLQSLKFIKIIDLNKADGYELRNSAYDLFEGKKDLFLNWLLTFPIKTPSGRYLSPKNEDTVAGTKLRKKWKKSFGSDTLNQQRAIDILQAEIDWRKKTGKMEFIHNAETWLNQGDWEKYEHLLQDKQKVEVKQKEDFI